MKPRRFAGGRANAMWLCLLQVAFIFMLNDMLHPRRQPGTYELLLYVGLATLVLFLNLSWHASDLGHNKLWGLMSLLGFIGTAMVYTLPDKNQAVGFPVLPLDTSGAPENTPHENS